MTEIRTSITSHATARVAIVIVGLLVALAFGAPWLLNDAPPSPEAVFAAKLCCVKAPSVVAPHAASTMQSAK